MELATIKEIEDLHHHKCIEYECEVPRINVVLIEDRCEVWLPVDEIKPA